MNKYNERSQPPGDTDGSAGQYAGRFKLTYNRAVPKKSYPITLHRNKDAYDPEPLAATAFATPFASAGPGLFGPRIYSWAPRRAHLTFRRNLLVELHLILNFIDRLVVHLVFSLTEYRAHRLRLSHFASTRRRQLP